MAHLIDRTFCTVLAVALAYAAALIFTGSVPLAMLAGFIVPIPLRALARWLRRHLSGSKFSLRRSRRRRAQQTVSYWSTLRDKACRDDIFALLRTAYPAAAPCMALPDNAGENAIPLHILMTLRPVSEDAMADTLRRIREAGHARAVIVCTSQFSPEARTLAQLPQHAHAILIDGDMLGALLAKHTDAVPFRRLMENTKPKFPLARAHALRMLPTAVLLMTVYHIFGLKLYLPAALALMWASLMLLRRKPAPDLLA